MRESRHHPKLTKDAEMNGESLFNIKNHNFSLVKRSSASTKYKTMVT